MKPIIKKLNSRRGASLLIALLFFFMAAMVGSVIVASASTNVDRIFQREQRRQDYLALNSAVRFLRETLNGLEGTAWEQKDTYGCKTEINIVSGDRHRDDVITSSGKVTYSATAEDEDGDGRLQMLLAKMAYETYRRQMDFVLPLPMGTVDPVTFSVEGEGMPVVDVTVIMDEHYAVLLTLQVENSSESAEIFLKPSKVDVVKQEIVLECEHTCQYTDYVDGKSVTYQVEKNFSNGKTYKNTLTVLWDKVTVSKGGG